MISSVLQVNLQTHFGGGEVYTAFLCQALSRLGIATRLLVHPEARFWSSLDLPEDTQLVPAADWSAVRKIVPEKGQWIIAHGAMPAEHSAGLSVRHFITSIAHMPPQGRNGDFYPGCDLVLAVSDYVRQGLLEKGLPVWQHPLYGVAVLATRNDDTPLRQSSRYDWDKRKGRDRLLCWLEPWVEPLRRRPVFTRREGITLGIVSRLTPIKQFPLLFSHLAPVLARHPRFKLEIFGSGGYASVRDLANVLAPLGSQVRWWGHQRDVTRVYQQLDYLMTGLPEKEALGLNVIEAQAAGTPVLAVNAQPFIETVLDGASGFFYTDPRQDRGGDFESLLTRIEQSLPRPDPTQATDHLQRFTVDALAQRLSAVLPTVAAGLQAKAAKV